MEIHDGWKNFQTHTFFFFAFDVRKIGKWKRLGPIWIKILGWMENVGEIAGWKIFRDEKKNHSGSQAVVSADKSILAKIP